MANFVITTHMTNGDVLPFLRFAVALKNSGHEATLVTHGAFGPVAAKAGINFEPIDEPEEYTQIMKDLQWIEDPLNRPDLVQKYEDKYYSREKYQKEYDILVRLCQKENSVLVCKERDGYVAMIVSEKLGVPIVTGVLAPSYVTQIKVWEELDLNYMISLINGFRAEVGLPPVKNWMSWMSSVKKNIGFWHETYDKAIPAPEWGMEIDTVGFPLAAQAEYEPLPDDLLEFIHAGEPPLLITGGTGKMLKPNFYEASIQACKQLGRRTILVTRHEEFIQSELPDFIKWYKILPLAGVYPLLGGVIHHGGIGTITGAMSAGVPQLALAADTDRPDNGMRIKLLGLGDYLPPLRWQTDIIAQAIEGMLQPSVQERCRKMAQMMREHDTMAAACEAIKVVIGNKDYAISGDKLQEALSEMKAKKPQPADPKREERAAKTQSASMTSEKRAWLARELLRRRGLDTGASEPEKKGAAHEQSV